MNLTNYYWYFQSAIPERICDDIVRYGKSLQDQMAVTGGYGDKKLNQTEVKDLKKKRDSNVVCKLTCFRPTPFKIPTCIYIC